MRTYEDFFHDVMGHAPYPYQRRLVEQDVPLVDVPTGLGKTAGVVLAWLFRRLTQPSETPRRLVYCLPMRALVSQVHQCCEGWLQEAKASFAAADQKVPKVYLLMGGFLQEEWERAPEEPAILVGTQDMLLSRALNRGYGMSRFRWPVHFGLLNNDAMWVFDEPQVMGVAVETGAQLQAFRDSLGVSLPARSLWMSATLERGQLATIDQSSAPATWSCVSLDDEDREHQRVKQRIHATKLLHSEPVATVDDKGYPKRLAEQIASVHRSGSLTLVVINQVQRACDVYQALREHLATGKGKKKQYPDHVLLLHSRFRPVDRQPLEARLKQASDDRQELIAIATQVVEAGLELDAQSLITELCPWPSFVQRAGRCNRAGELAGGGEIHWIDMDESKADQSAPYDAEEISLARKLLLEQGGDVSPAALTQTSQDKYDPPLVIRPVLRRKDLLSLFDTTPDLLGDDIDVSRFVRDGQDNTVSVYWRHVHIVNGVPDETCPPVRDEICGVPIGSFHEFLKKLKARNGSKKPEDRLYAWSWDHLASGWCRVDDARPGLVVMLPAEVGGYLTDEGWTGTPNKSGHEVEVLALPNEEKPGAWGSMSDDHEAQRGQWITLTEHLAHVQQEARAVVSRVSLPTEHAEAIVTGALWHDVGKAHQAGFQAKLASREGSLSQIWAKSPIQPGAAKGRPYYRHELASALAWHQRHPEHLQRDLIAYLIVAHHGKIRASIRALPQESGNPDEPEALFARGVWQDDTLEAFAMPDGQILDGVSLDLSMMQMGAGSWLERCLALIMDRELGPFRLGFLESLLRIADWRASAAEADGLLQTGGLSLNPTPPTEDAKQEPDTSAIEGAAQLSLFGESEKGGGS